MTGTEQILKVRKAGYKPSCVFLEYGKTAPKDSLLGANRQISQGFYPIVYAQNPNIDLRCLTDLRVIASIHKEEDVYQFIKKLEEVKPKEIFLTDIKNDESYFFSEGQWKEF